MSEPTAARPGPKQPSRKQSSRVRSLTESLLTIVLGLEAFLVFFVTLAVYGLTVLDPVITFAGGGVLVLALVLGTRVLRYRWGVWVGWALQLPLVATGLLLPIMYFIAAGFVALWVYCLTRGRQIDARNATARTSPSDPPQEPE